MVNNLLRTTSHRLISVPTDMKNFHIIVLFHLIRWNVIILKYHSYYKINRCQHIQKKARKEYQKIVLRYFLHLTVYFICKKSKFELNFISKIKLHSKVSFTSGSFSYFLYKQFVLHTSSVDVKQYTAFFGIWVKLPFVSHRLLA